MRIPIHKIKQYSLFNLFKIFIYRVIYEFLLSFEYLKNVFTQNEIKPSFQKKDHVRNIYHTISSKMSSYYSLCDNDINRITEQADRILNGELIVLGYKYHFDYKNDWLKDPITGNFWEAELFFSKSVFKQKNCSDVKYVLELNKFNHLVIISLAYYKTRNEKYIYHLYNELKGWTECVPSGKSVVNRIIMDLGFRAINLIQISLLCCSNEYFITHIHPLIIGILDNIESQMRKFSTPRWFKAGNDNNHVTGEMVGLIVTQVWLNQFLNKNYSRDVKVELKYLEKTLNKTISNNGVYLEQSANYTRVVSEFLIFFDLFTKSFSLIDKYNLINTIEKYLTYILLYISNLSYHNTLPNFGDNDNARVLIPFIKDINSINYITTYISFLRNRNLQIGLKKYLDGSQWLYKSKDTIDLYLFTRVGEYAYTVEGSYIHAHNDMLSLLMYAKGIPIFIDKGCLYYNSGVDIKKSYVKTSAHNTISIENLEQSKILPIGFADYPKSKYFAIEYPYIFKGDVLYKNDGVHHTRKIKYQFLTLTIEDVVYTGSNIGTINFLLSEEVKPIQNSSNEIALYNKHNEKLALIIFSPFVQCKIIDEEYYPNYGEKRTTSKIIGMFKINNKIKLVTQIVF